MRILDQDKDSKVDQVTIFLQLEEAKQLRDSLNELISNPSIHHSHISSEDYQKEITVCIYNETDTKLMQQFDKRSLKLIEKDV